MHNQIAQDVIGTEAAPVTLTTAFADTVGSTMLAKNFNKLALDVKYTPAAAGATYVQLIVEYSDEDIGHGTPSNWKQYVTSVSASTQIDVYGQSGLSMGTVSGTPIIIPTSGSAVAAQAITVHINPDTDLVAHWVRVRAKEVTTGAAGTLYVRMALQSC